MLDAWWLDDIASVHIHTDIQAMLVYLVPPSIFFQRTSGISPHCTFPLIGSKNNKKKIPNVCAHAYVYLCLSFVHLSALFGWLGKFATFFGVSAPVKWWWQFGINVLNLGIPRSHTQTHSKQMVTFTVSIYLRRLFAPIIIWMLWLKKKKISFDNSINRRH